MPTLMGIEYIMNLKEKKMIEKLTDFAKSLDDKASQLMVEIAKTDPTSETYFKLLNNFNSTMSIAGIVGRSLQSVVDKLNKEGEINNESNN
jgi:tRNA G26 N,N-dimethylase Trm1